MNRLVLAKATWKIINLTWGSRLEFNDGFECVCIRECHEPEEFDPTASLMEIYLDGFLFFFEDLKMRNIFTEFEMLDKDLCNYN